MRVARQRVVVVGGGLAGLSAAITCADAGVDVLLLESRGRLGGATFSFGREGMLVDNGQHVFLRCCTAYRGFLRRIGAESRTVLQPRMSIPVVAPGGRTGWLRRNGLPAPLHLASCLSLYPFLGPLERLRAAWAALALAREVQTPALDRRTFGAWLREHRQSDRAIENLWNLIALPTLNLPADEASLALAVTVFRTGLLDASDAGDIGYADVPLSELHAEPAARAIASAGGVVRTRAAVRAIEPGSTGKLGVLAGGERIEAAAVVLAVPHEDAADLLPPGAIPDAPALRLLGRAPIVNVHVVFDRPVIDVPFAAGIGSPVQWVFDRTRQSGLDAGHGRYVVVSLSGATRELGERTQELRRRFLPALGAMFPAALGAKVDSFFVTREPAATFRQAPGTAGLRPGPVTGVPGLFVAGAWTDTGWPATMEGAVRAGRAAASAAIAHTVRRSPIGEAVPA
jgi:squalene-associated FAD-dependent desaturase